MNGLPFDPEGIEAMTARYPEAIREVCDSESAMLGVGWMPGERRANVFDFEDGLRMIISRDDMPRWGRVLHFSASINPTMGLAELIVSHRLPLQGFLDLCVERFRTLSGETGTIEFRGTITPKGIPHWLVREP